MAIINAGGFAQVPVPLGYALSISGAARVYVAPPRPASLDGGPFVVNDPDVIGPFPVAVTLNIEAAGDVSYSVVMSPLVGDPVVSQTDPITGAVSLVSGGGNLGIASITGRSLMHIRPVGLMVLSAALTTTRHGVYILPGVKWWAYKARLHNAHTAPVDYKCCVTTQAALGDGYYNAATWDQITFGGSATGTVPAGSGALPQAIEGVLDSDIVYKPSADYQGGTILAVRSYCATANNTRLNPPGGAVGATLSGNRFISAYLTGTDAVADPTLFTGSTTIDALPPVSIIAYSRNQVRRIGLFGASTLSGQADGVQLGWHYRTAQALSTDSRCWQFVNNSMPSSKTSLCLQRALARFAAGDVFDDAVLSIFSTNDSTDSDYGTAAYLNRLRGQIAVFIDACGQRGIRPWLATFQYPTGMTGTAYEQCKAINAYARQLAASGACDIFDIAGLFSDEAAAVGTWLVPANTADGTHPNTTGTVALAAYAQTVFA